MQTGAPSSFAINHVTRIDAVGTCRVLRKWISKNVEGVPMGATQNIHIGNIPWLLMQTIVMGQKRDDSLFFL